MGDGGGDGTGRSQRVSGGAEKVPMLGKLPILPIVKVECKTKSEEKVFRGDPGSIFLVNCPEGCSEFEGIMYFINSIIFFSFKEFCNNKKGQAINLFHFNFFSYE